LIDGYSHGRNGSSLLGRTYGWFCAEIADERRSLAALVSGLTGAQQATQSL